MSPWGLENKAGQQQEQQQTYRGVHIQDLFVPLVLEEQAVGVVINHLKVGAGVGRGHLCLPVVVAVEKITVILR